MTVVSANLAGASLVPAFLDTPVAITTKMPSQPGPSDVPVLTSRMARGDEAAFHEFYKLYFNRLLRYLLVVTHGQEEIAREALQLAFMRVARHVRKFDSETAFWNWLAVLGRNCAVDELRKRTRQQGLLARFFQQRPAAADSKSSDADARLEELLHHGLAGLPNDERALLERKYFSGETVRALADEWQITEKAMESRLLRLREKLKTTVLERLKNETDD
jgi:RNA polymerase sigma-70 factor (ECF subfamily)